MGREDIKQTLLQLTNSEKKEVENIKKDYFFYLGATNDKDAAILDETIRGQSWISFDNVDYVPSQVIDNRIKPLIHKQARFFLGKSPDLLFKPRDKKDKDKCEELRIFIDDILNSNKFWSNTLKAFRLATVTKRTLLRMEANPKQPIKLVWHDVTDFKYQTDPGDMTKLTKVIFVKQDETTADKTADNQLWCRYIYTLEQREDDLKQYCYLTKETFISTNLETPVNVEKSNTLLSKIPCVIIVNEYDLVEQRGKSDIKDLKDLQNQINRKLSDFSDALRFQMFGQTVIIDATEATVNDAKIAPNSLLALKSEDGEKNKAQAHRVESSFSNAEPIKMFIQILDDSMHDKLDMPKPEQLKSVPSAKTIKYIYNDLIARCEEKWNDVEPPIRTMLRLMVEACSVLKCYDNWKSEWDDLEYSTVLLKNYPIPEDSEDKKRLAIEEVNSNVRSHRSYIKDFGDDEDYEEHFNETLEDIKSIAESEQNLYGKSLEGDLSAGGEV